MFGPPRPFIIRQPEDIKEAIDSRSPYAETDHVVFYCHLGFEDVKLLLEAKETLTSVHFDGTEFSTEQDGYQTYRFIISENRFQSLGLNFKMIPKNSLCKICMRTNRLTKVTLRNIDSSQRNKVLCFIHSIRNNVSLEGLALDISSSETTDRKTLVATLIQLGKSLKCRNQTFSFDFQVLSTPVEGVFALLNLLEKDDSEGKFVDSFNFAVGVENFDLFHKMIFGKLERNKKSYISTKPPRAESYKFTDESFLKFAESRLSNFYCSRYG